MAKLVKNANYVASEENVKQIGKYLFDAEDGTEADECSVWNEKSKASEAHPDGKPWIRSAKMTEVTNRQYFSEDLFIASDNGDGVIVEVKTAAPRVLGATSVKPEIIKYLDEATAAEYQALVESATAKFKAAKGTGKKKPEEMTEAELLAYIDALKNGTKVVLPDAPKSFLDVLTDDEYKRYNEILALSAENKANAPKAVRAPLTEEQKAARAEKRQIKELSKAEALLAALRAPVEETENDELIDDEDLDVFPDED